MRHCIDCGRADEAGGRFCAYCGAELPVSAPAAAAAVPPSGPPPAQPPVYGYPPPDAADPVSGQFVYPPAAVPPPPSSSNTGLVVGLVAASAVALGGVIAAIAIAAGGGSDPGPTVAAASTPTTTTSAAVPTTAAVTTVTATRTATTSSATRSRAARRRATPGVAPRRSTTVEDTIAVRRAIRTHWDEKRAGNYEASYAYLAPGFQQRDPWIQGMTRDNLTSYSIVVGQVSFTSASRATATVERLRTYASDGCHRWNGSYAMTRNAGRWQIADSNLNRMSC